MAYDPNLGFDPSDPYGMFGGSSDPSGGYYTDPFGASGVGGMYGSMGYSYGGGPSAGGGQGGGYSGYGSTDGTDYYDNNGQQVNPGSYQPYSNPYSSSPYINPATGLPYGSYGTAYNGGTPTGSYPTGWPNIDPTTGLPYGSYGTAYNGGIPPGSYPSNYTPPTGYTGGTPGGNSGGGDGGNDTTINNTYNPPAPGGTGTGGMDPAYPNAYYNAALAALQAQMYGSDQSLAGVRYGADMSHQNAQLTYQSAMAQIANQGQYYQGLLQQGQLDDATKRYISDQQAQLGYAAQAATAQYQQGLLDVQNQRLYGLEIPQMQGQLGVAQQNANTTQMGTLGNLDLQRQLGMGQLGLGAGQLALQSQLGLGNLGISQQGANTQQAGVLGNLALGAGQLGLQSQLGLGNLGVSQQGANTQQAGVLGNLALGQGQLGLQSGLGYGNLGISQQQADTARYAQEVAAQLGMGNLGLGYGQLQAAVENARNQVALQRAQVAASLQGPRNAFAQQAYLHGLNQNGVSNAVDMIAGRQILPQWGAAQGPLEPANLGTFQQDTGLPVPGGA